MRDHLEAIYAFILNIIMWVLEIFVVISQVHDSEAYTPAKKLKFFKMVRSTSKFLYSCERSPRSDIRSPIEYYYVGCGDIRRYISNSQFKGVYSSQKTEIF